MTDILEFGPHRSAARAAVEDVSTGMQQWRFWTMLGWSDVRQRYTRSSLGPFWITANMAVMIGTLTFIYGAIFKVPAASYLPYLAGGMITWLFVSTTIVEGTNSFIAADGIIKQSSIPLSIYVYRVIWRNFVTLLHNALVLLVVIPFTVSLLSINPLLILLGMLIVLANLFVICLVLAVLATRFRDLPPIAGSGMQLLFYVTPILYEPSQLPGKMQLVAHFNPLYHLIDVLRRPLIGAVPDAFTYVVTIGMFFTGGAVAFLLLRRFRGRVAYWL